MFERFKGGDETAKMVAQIQEGAMMNGQDLLRAVKGLGTKWKPPGLDADTARLRDYFEGAQGAYLDDAMSVQFPATHKLIPRVVLNFARLYADVAAAVFDMPPEFWLEGEQVTEGTDEEGNPTEISESGRLPPEDPRAQLFAQEIEDSQLVAVLASVERKAQLPKSIVIRAGWDSVGKHVCFSAFYPNEVQIAVHPSRPESLSHAYMLAARVASEVGSSTNPEDQVWEVWRRGFDEDENGIPEFAEQWTITRLTGKGQILSEGLSPMGASFPWVLFVTELPSGSPWPKPDVAITMVQDAINISQSNELYIGNMQAHTEKVYNGNDNTKKVGGPGRIMQLAPGETMTTLDYNPKMADLQNGRAQLVQLFGRTKRQSPDAYTAESGSVLSGVSRKIANEPQEKQRQEAATVARPIVRDLLDAMIAVHDHHAVGTDVPTYGEGVDPNWKPADPLDYEEPEAMQRRIFELQAKGLITEARAAVMLGVYEDEQAAAADGLSDERKAPQAPQIGAQAGEQTQTLAQRLMGRRPPPAQAADDGEG